MVMFHHEIPYLTALERGVIQARLLERADRAAPLLSQDIDYGLAGREIESRLAPIRDLSRMRKL